VPRRLDARIILQSPLELRKRFMGAATATSLQGITEE
jgi:hypothetical protein